MSSDPKPASLRDTYTKPNVSWSFPPQQASNGTSTSLVSRSGPVGSSSTIPHSGSVKTLDWGTSNGSSNSFVDASLVGSTPSSYLGSSYAAGSYPYGPSVYGPLGGNGNAPRIALKALLASAFIQYTTTAIAMPWEVGKVLLQVQWVPKQFEGQIAEQLELQLEIESQEEDENDEMSESSTDDSYFHDPVSPTRQTRQARAKAGNNARKMSTGLSVTKSGISPLVIAYGPADGVWGMMKRVGRWRTEGWPSLWKGLLTSVSLSLLTSTIQPSISSFLRPIFPTHSHLIHPLFLPLTSHIITGIILSPLDTLRTLQIIHPRPSPSPFTHFSLLTSNTKSPVPITLGTLYTHPTLLYPAILDNTLRPLISLLMPRIIEHVTGVRIGVNVWMYPLCEFIGGVIGLGLTIPIETVRRRLQAQVIVHGLPDVNPESGKYSTAKSSPIVGSPKLEDGRVPSCVHLSPRPYTGIFDCIWRILTEERSGPPPHHHHSKRRTGSRPMMRSPRASSTSTTPKPRQGKNKNVSRLSGGGSSGSKRDVRNVFDAEAAAVGAGGGTSSSGAGGHHRPRMLSEEMRESERRVLNYRPSPQSNLGPSSSGVSGAAQESTQFAGKVEQEFERAKEEIEREGLEGWLEGTGVGQLYRGFGMGVGALALVLVLGLITGEESEGWAEL